MYNKREWSILCTTKVLARKSAKKNDNWIKNSEVELSRKPEVESRKSKSNGRKWQKELEIAGKWEATIIFILKF